MNNRKEYVDVDKTDITAKNFKQLNMHIAGV